MRKTEFEALINFRDTNYIASQELKDLLLLNKVHNLDISEQERDQIRVTLGVLYRIWNKTERKIQKEFESRGWN